jgi:flagellar protein FliO/FliZ
MNFFDLIRALAALSLTLGLLIGAAWLARRYGLMQGQLPSLAKGRLKIVEQIWLDAGRTRAILLRHDNTEHLLIVTPTGATALSRAPIPQDPASPADHT